MTFDYAPLAQASVDMLRTYGQAATLRRSGPGNGPAHNPGEVTTNYACTAFVSRFRLGEIDGVRVLATDKLVLIAPDVAVEPKPGDLIVEADGAILTVVGSTPVKPAGTVLLHRVQARR